MWIFLGAAVMLLVAFITRPFSTALSLFKFAAFAVAAVAAFALYMGGPADMYAAPAMLGAMAWLGLQFVPTPRYA